MVIFEIVVQIIAGCIPAVPAFLLTHRILMSRKPVVQKLEPSSLTPLLEHYTQRTLEVEGKVAPKVIETKSGKKRQETVMEANYRKWANNRAAVPFVKTAIVVLKTISSTSSLDLSLEDQHNLEVLSTQTEKLLSNWYETPEEVRNLPQVKEAFDGQLAEISEGTKNLTVNASENLVRNLNIGTGFIQTKYNNNKSNL